MYEARHECERFDQWLLDEGPTEIESPVWREHLNGCPECSEQWEAHQALAFAFAEEPVPELSPMFASELDSRMANVVEVEPLRGWKRAAMVAYTAIAAWLFSLVLRTVDLPRIDIELSSPWVTVALFIAMPLSFLLAIAASRFLPDRGLPRGMRMFSL